mmetsp:Transcript_6299/g.9599  ORF Transcript_6299/g.9599 Transcript_6299/m.9599 type:complete len:286 (-) Transcript_6299:379-1236(-)
MMVTTGGLGIRSSGSSSSITKPVANALSSSIPSSSSSSSPSSSSSEPTTIFPNPFATASQVAGSTDCEIAAITPRSVIKNFTTAAGFSSIASASSPTVIGPPVRFTLRRSIALSSFSALSWDLSFFFRELRPLLFTPRLLVVVVNRKDVRFSLSSSSSPLLVFFFFSFLRSVFPGTTAAAAIMAGAIPLPGGPAGRSLGLLPCSSPSLLSFLLPLGVNSVSRGGGRTCLNFNGFFRSKGTGLLPSPWGGLGPFCVLTFLCCLGPPCPQEPSGRLWPFCLLNLFPP